jgi:hypothetical protein
MAAKDLNRILDANFNRAKEGLRVCEDICRYVWNEKALTKAFKGVRHDLTGVINTMDFLSARNVGGDIGRPTSVSEGKRKDLNAVFFANAQRVKESLRVLEEIIKLINPTTAESIKGLRYKVYVLEQKAAGKR